MNFALAKLVDYFCIHKYVMFSQLFVYTYVHVDMRLCILVYTYVYVDMFLCV